MIEAQARTIDQLRAEVVELKPGPRHPDHYPGRDRAPAAPPTLPLRDDEHRAHAARGGRGRGVRAEPGALAVYLLVFQHVPVARTAALIADVTGARPSTGWISSPLSTVADVLIDVEKLIKSCRYSSGNTSLIFGSSGTRAAGSPR